MNAAARANVAAGTQQLEANRALAESYQQIAAEATAGSDEQRVAAKMAADAQAQANSAVVATAAEAVDAQKREVDANLELAASYREVAAAATRGSDEQVIASKLAADAQARASAVIGESAVAARTASGGFFSFGRSASGAEKELDRFGRGAAAGSGLASGLGRSLAFASGGFLAFATLSGTFRSAVSGAASVQKSVEAIRASFGGAAQGVLRFADSSSKLGVSANLADQTSAKFGILFKNLGVGQGQAAQMTVGFEKLAASISAIKGVDPTTVFQNIALAAAGNTRGLRQMGISIDTAQEKIAAFKLGLISSVTQALTPAQKAEAVYALATANLGKFQQEALAHTNDFANVQLRLAAAWSNAKDALGNALLPVFTRYATELANWLTKMTESGRLQADFNSALNTTKQVVSVLVSAISAAVTVFKDFSSAVGGAKNAIEILGAAFVGSKLLGGLGTMGTRLFAAKEGEQALATSSLTLGKALGNAGLAAQVGIASFALTTFLLKVTGADSKLKSFGAGVYDLMSKLNGFGQTGAPPTVPGQGQGLRSQAIFGSADKLAEALIGKGASKDAVEYALVKRFGGQLTQDDINVAIQYGSEQIVKKAIAPATQAGAELEKAFADALGQGAGGSAADAVKKGGDAIASSSSTIAQQVAAAYNKVEQAQASGITTMKNGLTTLQNSLQIAITKTGTDLANAVVQAKSNIDTLAGNLTSAINQTLQQPLTNLQNQLQLQQDKLSLNQLRRQVMLPGGKELSANPKTAIAELKSIVDKSSSYSKAAVQNFLIQYQQAVLAVRQDQVNQHQIVATRRVNDLADSLKRGDITGKQFNERLLATLKSYGVSYKKVGKLLGSAVANGFNDSVKGILAQATALGAVPGRAGFTDPTVKIVRPLDTLHRDQERVARIQVEIRDKHGALLQRIATANEKATVAAQKQLALLQQKEQTKVGRTASSRLTGPGARKARHANGTVG